MDRLLKPDMALQNDGQSKKFTADGSGSINNRQVSVHFTFTSKHPRKIFLEHEIPQRAGFIRRLTTADAARMRLRHSKQW
jgi:hypothetical protein